MWYLHRVEYYSAIRKKEIMLFATTWMDLEVIIRSEVRSERETQTSYDTAYMWKLKKSCKRTYLQNRNGVTDVENNLMVNAGEEEERQIGILGLTYIHTIYKTENQ